MASRLDMDALESASGQVSSIAANFSAELGTLGSLVAGTKEYWDDPAQVSFETKYEEFKVSMNNFIATLDFYSKAMKQYADSRRAQEASGARMFDSI